MKQRHGIIASLVLASATVAGCSQHADEAAPEETIGTTGASTQGLSVAALPRPAGAVLAQIPATPETISETGGLVRAWQVYPYRATIRQADQVAAVGAYVVGVDAQGSVHAVIRARQMSNAAAAVEVTSMTGDLSERARLIKVDTTGYGAVAPAAVVVAGRVARDLPAYHPPPRDPVDYCPPGRRCIPRDAEAKRSAEMGLAAVKIGIAAARLVGARGTDLVAWAELGHGLLELVVAEGTIPDNFAKTNWNHEYNAMLDAVGLGNLVPDPLKVLYKDQDFMRSIGVANDPRAFNPESVVDSFGLPLTYGIQTGMISASTGSLFTSGIGNPSWADAGGSLGVGFSFGGGGFSFGDASSGWGGGFGGFSFGGGGGGGGVRPVELAY